MSSLVCLLQYGGGLWTTGGDDHVHVAVPMVTTTNVIPLYVVVLFYGVDGTFQFLHVWSSTNTDDDRFIVRVLYLPCPMNSEVVVHWHRMLTTTAHCKHIDTNTKQHIIENHRKSLEINQNRRKSLKINGNRSSKIIVVVVGSHNKSSEIVRNPSILSESGWNMAVCQNS